ncbi:unnamed protein product [Cuscuta campestris]|uniref:RING-type domain-containing protein n=1 Tax=Cuscuta campestris TaxID=132261 RepID=A0A484KGR5_9ASTE|nr:unnamed protein product [Cuscuta campestris]
MEANGIQSEEKESSDLQCCQSNAATKRRSSLLAPTISSSRKVKSVKIGQPHTPQNKPTLPPKTNEQQNSKSREKTADSANRGSKSTTKQNGNTSAPKEEDKVKAQTSQPTKDFLSEVRRSRSQKTSDLQQGEIKASPVPPTKVTPRSKKSNTAAGTSTPQQTSLEKGKTPISGSQSRPSTSGKKSSSLTKDILSNEPIYHIECAGLSRKLNKVGVTCGICEEDLSYVPSDYESEYYGYEEELGTLNYPEVAVLHCGHSFHNECFAYSIPDERSCDPPCVLCASFIT